MHRLVIALAFVAVIAVAVSSLSRAGYCFGVGRWVSERERMEAAIGLALSGGNARQTLEPTRRGDTPMEFWTPPYASGAEFLAAHPGCCRFGVDTHYEFPPITRGEAGITTVVVDFDVQARAHDGSERPITARTTVAVDRCGRRSDGFAFFRVGRTSWHD